MEHDVAVIGLAIKMIELLIKGTIAMTLLGFFALAGMLWAFFAILAVAQGQPSPNWGLTRASEKAYRRLTTGPDLPH